MAASTTFFLLIICTALTAVAPSSPPASTPNPLNISAVFAFGDSILDTGNNNGFPTAAQANHPPYGCNFPGQVATGRFSDGRLIPDLLVSSLGIGDRVPAYLGGSLTGRDFPGAGVCFASAGSGLDDLTSISTGVLTIDIQVKNFGEYLQKLQQSMGSEAAAQKVVGSALFIINSGGNDLKTFSMFPARTALGLSGYHNFLLQRLQSLVQQLHSLGGRRFAVAGILPAGCVPVAITLAPGLGTTPRACNDVFNQVAVQYNSMLQAMLPELKASLSDARIAYVDMYTPLLDMIHAPEQYGFTETNRGCCGTGLTEMGPLCSPTTPHCPDPSKFVFWDAVHPSQAAYQAISQGIMKTVIPQL